jgi:hypothetical protein
MDDHDLPLASAALRRLRRKYNPGDCIGAVRRVHGAVTAIAADNDAGELETYPPQFLAVMWQPQDPDRPFMPRWPCYAALAAPGVAAAVSKLLAVVPRRSRLRLAAPTEIDWVVMARVVMLGEQRLEPHQYRELQAFIEAEQQRLLVSIGANFGAKDQVFGQFARTRPGALVS